MQLLCRTLLCRTNCDSRPLWCSLHSHWMFAPCHAHNAPQALTNIRTAAMIANAAITSAPSQHTRVPTNSRHSTMQVLQVNPSSFLFLDQLETPPDAKQLIPYPHQLLQRDIPRLPAPTHLGFVLNPSITTAEDDFASLLHAAALLSEGQVVAVPTETVYGLAANALDADAVQRIFAAKGRPSDNPLIAHVGSIQQAEELLQECDPTHAEHWAHLGAAHGGTCVENGERECVGKAAMWSGKAYKSLTRTTTLSIHTTLHIPHRYTSILHNPGATLLARPPHHPLPQTCDTPGSCHCWSTCSSYTPACTSSCACAVHAVQLSPCCTLCKQVCLLLILCVQGGFVCFILVYVCL